MYKIPNNLVLDFDHWILVFRFVSDFELRNSNFNSGTSWRDENQESDDSRLAQRAQRAPRKENKKLEARNPKYETTLNDINPNFQNYRIK